MANVIFRSLDIFNQHVINLFAGREDRDWDVADYESETSDYEVVSVYGDQKTKEEASRWIMN